MKQVTLGGNVYTYTWDDEDRLTQFATPAGTSYFTYNGLGLRTGKTDSTGIHADVCDGTTPSSPVLADGFAVYTPGLSDHRGSVSTFNHDDTLGSLRFLTNSSQNVTTSLLSDAFGETVGQSGTLVTPFAWMGQSGYQSDADGLKLLGHRYYDTRIGRFITQDPIGDGTNWYAYCGNSPTNGSDPTGLTHIDDFGAIVDDLTGNLPGYDPNNPATNIFNPDTAPEITIKVSAPLISGDDTGPSVLDDGLSGISVGVSAVGSAASFHLWDGGAAKNDSSFGVSRGLADVGVAAGTAAFGGAAGAIGRGAGAGETLVTHWGSASEIADIVANGFKEGTWVMKGKANIIKWILTGVFHRFPYGPEGLSRITLPVPSSSLTQEGTDIVQRLLLHYRIGP